MERRSPTPGAIRKRDAVHRLKTGLDEERFVLHYQPVVAARDLAVTGVEALLRWRAPEAEEAKLTELIEAVERSPVIYKLENWTLREACHAAARWRKAGLAGVRVNVNLSAREFPRADVVGRVRRQLRTARLDPSGLGLEITESSSIREFAAVAEQIQRLSDTGIELWLDDFGTGHSSLEWLSWLPCHGVKIPGTFVKRLFTEKRCQPIVTRVIELAHDLHLKVIAEGVETEEQRDALTRCGCDAFQGFLFYPAMPAEELPRTLAAARAPAASAP